MNSSALSSAQAALADQPFSVLIGSSITEFGPHMVELRLRLRAELMQQNGFAHGGVVSYMADNALAFMGGGALTPAVVTSEFKINYVRPAVGETLIARANVVHVGKKQAVCVCMVYCESAGQEKLVAVAQGTIVSLGDVSSPCLPGKSTLKKPRDDR